MKVKDITNCLERLAPLSYQESYDNSGLLVGNEESPIDNILITLDVNEEVIDEAVKLKSNLIITHHPLIFNGIKKLTGRHWVERTIVKAIQNEIAIYAIHTNLDNVANGVNKKIGEKIGLINMRILLPKTNTLTKLVTFIPKLNITEVRNALFDIGVGEIGNYDHCSFSIPGTGTFRPNDIANPHVGKRGEEKIANEERLEVIFPSYKSNQVISTLRTQHPYEEAAYYLTDLSNENPEVGSGLIGELDSVMDSDKFLQHIKSVLNLKVIKHTSICTNEVKSIALCGGSGSFLLKSAIAQKADVFITADFKYHDYFDADNQLIVADIGHYESEVFTKELLIEYLQEKFANIAVRLSQVNTNPINYL